MSYVTSLFTALVTLLAVFLGGWLSLRNQDRAWHRDHARQWRDIRLDAYNDFLSAYREFLAFTLEPMVNITALPHPVHDGIMMPFFDEMGRPYRERLEATKMKVSLVSELPETKRALEAIMLHVRHIAALRSSHSFGDIPNGAFQKLWAAQAAFESAARQELGLSIRTDAPPIEPP